MKLWEFDKLCRSEWENGNGQVETLWLLNDSLQELGNDIILYGQDGGGRNLPVQVEDLPRIRAGDFPMYAVNPLTRDVVKLRISRDMDVADVRFKDGHMETHVLERKLREGCGEV